MLAILIGIIAGMGISLQTAVNSRLRSFLTSPFLTSFVSFSVGAMVLFSLTLLSGHSIIPTFSQIAVTPWWAWLGGLLGMVGLTSNVLLFSKLGGVQTAVIPILGQVLMGCLIDTFGWLNSPQADFSLNRFIGLILVLSGVFSAVVLPNIKSLRRTPIKVLWLWQLLGIFSGILTATQTAVNAELSRFLGSTTHATAISMLGGMLSIIWLVIYERSFSNLRFALGRDKPYWIWCGGVLGAFYVSVGAWLVQYVGTGGSVVLMLCGLIAMSLVIDKFGWLSAPKKKIQKIQLLGLLLLISGVA